jgi:predicted SAM-dependent methyltransferase
MNGVCVNIACGDAYAEGWCNFDYIPYSTAVKQANLLERLPVSDGEADVVYSSHFLEHIPRSHVGLFLAECFRITKPGGRVRLVLPDLEEMCGAYLKLRLQGKHDKADFLVLEMLDQCVRTVSGGELGAFYERMQAGATNVDMPEFVKQRTGHIIRPSAPKSRSRLQRLLRHPVKLVGKLEQLYIRAVLALLPSAFRQQNVSLASLGERHAWIYDYYTVQQLLHKAGFVDVQRLTATTSAIRDFPFHPLDIDAQGEPRKGVESMYIEARKA